MYANESFCRNGSLKISASRVQKLFLQMLPFPVLQSRQLGSKNFARPKNIGFAQTNIFRGGSGLSFLGSSFFGLKKNK
jgi:hypothetical protein